MDITLWQYLAVFILIGFSGFIDSIAGGGGLVSIPTYMAVGVPIEFILGTNKCVSSTGTTLAVYRYILSKSIYWKTMISSIIAALIGSALGADLSSSLSKNVMFGMLLCVVPLIFILQGRQGRSRGRDRADSADLSLGSAAFRAAVIGLVVGGYDGLFGPGTGTFLLLAFMAFLHMSTRDASANARIVNYASNLSAFFYFLLQGRIYWPVAAVAMAGSICGNWIGSGMVLKDADRVVVPVFRFVLLLLLMKCGYDFYRS